jgi:hypothetical protein
LTRKIGGVLRQAKQQRLCQEQRRRKLSAMVLRRLCGGTESLRPTILWPR